MGWDVRHALFTRTGLTTAAHEELEAHGGITGDINRLMHDLASAEVT